MSTTLKMTAVMAVSLAMTLTAAAKDHGNAVHNRWHDRDGWQLRRVADRDHDHDARRDRDHDGDRNRRDRDHDGDRDRDHEGRGNSMRGNHGAQGSSHGRKTGWGNCNVPPGQAKKYGCGPSWGYRDNDHDGAYGGNRTHGPVYGQPRTTRPVTGPARPHGPIYTQSRTSTPTQSRPHGPIYTQRKTDKQ